MYNHRHDWMSDDQYKCYEFLAELFYGWHHICAKVKPCGKGIEINKQSDFATFDFDYLTRAVIMAHDSMIRFEISPSGPGMLKLVLHKRHTREGRMHERHPTIEEAIKHVRKNKYAN